MRSGHSHWWFLWWVTAPSCLSRQSTKSILPFHIISRLSECSCCWFSAGILWNKHILVKLADNETLCWWYSHTIFWQQEKSTWLTKGPEITLANRHVVCTSLNWVSKLDTSCSPNYHPCDVGIQRSLKLSTKKSYHEDIVQEMLVQINKKSEIFTIDNRIMILQNQSVQYGGSGMHITQ